MSIWRPDPTFYPSPKMAMDAPAEKLAYVAMVNGQNNGRHDAIGVVDVDPASTGYGHIVGQLDMPNAGDELHHFGWSACSSAAAQGLQGVSAAGDRHRPRRCHRALCGRDRRPRHRPASRLVPSWPCAAKDRRWGRASTSSSERSFSRWMGGNGGKQAAPIRGTSAAGRPPIQKGRWLSNMLRHHAIPPNAL